MALRECARVGRLLAMAVPNWPNTADEPYHYSVVPKALWGHLLGIAGWRIAADFSGRRDILLLCTRNAEDYEAAHAKFTADQAEHARQKAARAATRKGRPKRRHVPRSRSWTAAEAYGRGANSHYIVTASASSKPKTQNAG